MLPIILGILWFGTWAWTILVALGSMLAFREFANHAPRALMALTRVIRIARTTRELTAPATDPPTPVAGPAT
jgi:hypothetical protein